MPIPSVQRRGRREVGVGGARVACLAAKPGEAGVAVGDERLHADLLGEGQRGTVVRAGGGEVRRPGARRDFAEHVPDHRLRAPRMLLAGDLEAARRGVLRLGRASGQEVRLAEPGERKDSSTRVFVRATARHSSRRRCASAGRPDSAYTCPRSAVKK